MKIKERLKLDFLKEKQSKNFFSYLFNFRKIWQYTIIITSILVLVPLLFFALTDYNISKKNIESETFLRTSRVVSNTRRAISYLILERKASLNFIIQNNSYEELKTDKDLNKILINLKKTIGQFSDISVVDDKGRLVSYAGDYNLKNIVYANELWFKEVIEKEIYISDVFLGFRQTPHLIIAIKKELPNGSFFILRTSLEISLFEKLLSELELISDGDAFLINNYGFVQTISKYYGNALNKIDFPVPTYSKKSQVIENIVIKDKESLVGYAYIEETPFILVIIKNKKNLMATWQAIRFNLISYLIISIAFTLMVIVLVATYLVNSIYIADKKRIAMLHNAEFSNKMSAIGRLAAGVAHEINNPLAIINEKAGLILDIFSYKEEYKNDTKLKALASSIIASVERCSVITRNLLSFSRNPERQTQKIKLKEVVNEVLSFLIKEAKYRSIDIIVDIPEDIPILKLSKVKVQQVFLNLFNNSFAALNDGGILKISAQEDKENIIIDVIDNGSGIKEEDMKNIFEPFFTTKSEKGGTGLGLAITFAIIKEFGGSISVKSKVNEGTTFTIILPKPIN